MKRKVNEEQVAARFQKMFSDPQTRASILIEQAKTMALDPPCPPRSAKRKKTLEATLKAKAKRAGLWAAKHPFLQDEAIDPLVRKSLCDGNAPEVLQWISEGVKLADMDPSLSIFARHVIVATRQAAHLMRSKKRMPTKTEIRQAVECVFRQSGWGGFLTEPQRWTEIFNAANLSDMQTGEGK